MEFVALRRRLVRSIVHALHGHPRVLGGIRSAVRSAALRQDILKHSAAKFLPQIIQPDPKEIFITLTANCNLRCKGCRYGRDFMPGSQLPWPIVRDLLDDCKRFGINSIRLYGGEPLLHRDLPKIVEYANKLGLRPWLTTNGILLKEKIDELFNVGLRDVSVGYYGTGEEYNAYVQRKDRYALLECGIAYARERYGLDLRIALGWVLMRPTCNVDEIQRLWMFAERYFAPIGVSLIHYSLPYFTEGPDQELQFRPQDSSAIEKAVAELIRMKQLRPELIQQSLMALRSIPDWLLKKSAMRVPCDRYHLLWVGADGTVQLCYVTFRLGNLQQQRLASMLFTAEHRRAAQDAFLLNCPNCHCSYHSRIEKDAVSRLRYS
jgi:molybdenum cofactor biosynthesis enzyme MoaA